MNYFERGLMPCAVACINNYPNQGLAKGDMCAVDMVHDGVKALEVKFVTLAGDTALRQIEWVGGRMLWSSRALNRS